MWWFLVSFALSFVAAIAFAPKPQTAPPAGLGDIEVPTAEDGREIPVIFGTRTLKGPNVVWWGDLETIPVQKSGGKK